MANRFFKQVIAADRDAYTEYKNAIRYEGGFSKLHIAITGSTRFHQLHWESLKDPDHPTPLAVEAPLIRKNRVRAQFQARVQPSPTLNILLVVARPKKRDVGYRTISRPLVTALRNSGIRAHIDIVRPGSFDALADRLDAVRTQHGDGYYHIVHCDMHGAVLPDSTAVGGGPMLYGDKEDNLVAVLAFDGAEPGKPHLVPAQQFADLLKSHQVPMVVLNACQSAKTEREPTEDGIPLAETNLAAHLMTAGVQWVVGMGYSVTVSAAEKLMQTLYKQLLADPHPDTALRQARRTIWRDKGRRAYYNHTIALEDWILPVVFQNSAVRFRLTDFASVAAENAWYERQATRYQAKEPTYGFHGRDLDILQLERKLLRESNLVLLRGMGGAGKTTLLRHLAEWWQTTGFVERVAYFGYDEKPWSLEQLLDGIGRIIFGEREYVRGVQPLMARARRQKVLAKLRSERHLLILDNLESVTGEGMAIGTTLPQAERDGLRDFVRALDGGRTVVLLGSRLQEEWLVAGVWLLGGTYELGGLDKGAARDMAEVILRRHGVERYRSAEAHRKAFEQLLGLLDGFPLALEVVLANLAHSTPAMVLEQLEAGDVAIAGATDAADRTNNLLRCIEVSHSNLAPQDQRLLLCLAPFRQVINADWLPQYIAQLQTAFAAAGVSDFGDFSRLPAVVQEAVRWGLLTLHEIGDSYLRFQPIFPYFLQTRLSDPTHAPHKNVIETAFRIHYQELGETLTELITSKESPKYQIGKTLSGLERNNLEAAMYFALENNDDFYNQYAAIVDFLLSIQQHDEIIEFSKTVLEQKESFSADQLTSTASSNFLAVIDRMGNSCMNSGKYEQAEKFYLEAIAIVATLPHSPDGYRAKSKAGLLHQLGVVRMKKREWNSAEHYLQQALQVHLNFNDRHRQASTLHQLGMVKQHQRGWDAAESYFQQALQIRIDLQDRYRQANSLYHLGVVNHHKVNWDVADSYFQRALQIFIDFDDRHRQADTLHNLGMLMQAQGKWELSETYSLQALQIFIDLNERLRQAGTLHNLGMMKQLQHEWDSAENYTQQALEIFIDFNDRYNQASSYGQLGVLAANTEKWSDAGQYLLRSLQISVEFGANHLVSQTVHNLARVWQQSSDTAIPDRLAALLSIPRAEAVARLENAT